jgi:hypothetical protein
MGDTISKFTLAHIHDFTPGGFLRCLMNICTCISPKDFGRVSGRPDSRVLRAKIPAIPVMQAQVRAPESQKVRGTLGGIPGESSIQAPLFLRILAHLPGVWLPAVPAHTRNGRHVGWIMKRWATIKVATSESKLHGNMRMNEAVPMV